MLTFAFDLIESAYIEMPQFFLALFLNCFFSYPTHLSISFFKKGEGVHVPDHKYHTNILVTYIYMSIHDPYSFVDFNIRKQI